MGHRKVGAPYRRLRRAKALTRLIICKAALLLSAPLRWLGRPCAPRLTNCATRTPLFIYIYWSLPYIGPYSVRVPLLLCPCTSPCVTHRRPRSYFGHLDHEFIPRLATPFSEYLGQRALHQDDGRGRRMLDLENCCASALARRPPWTRPRMGLVVDGRFTSSGKSTGLWLIIMATSLWQVSQLRLLMCPVGELCESAGQCWGAYFVRG